MSSKLGALLRHFRETDADALYLVPGEKIFVTRGTQKLVVGREPLSDESFRALAAEVVPDKGTETLARRRYRVPLSPEDGDENVEVQFGVVNGTPALMLTRALGAGVSSAKPLPARRGAERDLAPLPAAVPSREPSDQGPAATLPPRTTLTAPFSSALPVPPGTSAEIPPPSVTVARPIRPAGAPAPPASLSIRGPLRPGTSPGEGVSLQAFLASMAVLGASDGYFAAGAIPHVRVDGHLLAAEENEPLGGATAEKLLGAILPEACRRALAESGATRLVHDEPGVGRFRVLGFRDREGFGAVFRPIPHPAPTPKELELPEAVVRLAGADPGLVLVAGASGSGRTTTLAALVEAVNGSRACRIVTVEEPVEFLHPGRLSVVSQREAAPGATSLASHLSAALREAPDVLLVGPDLDASTAQQALEAVLSGSLVLAALRATSAAGALEELSSLLPEMRRKRLGEAVKGIVFQRLCRGASGGRRAVFAVVPGGGPLTARLRSGEGELPWNLSLDDSLFDLARRGAVAAVEALALAEDRVALLARLTAARQQG